MGVPILLRLMSLAAMKPRVLRVGHLQNGAMKWINSPLEAICSRFVPSIANFLLILYAFSIKPLGLQPLACEPLRDGGVREEKK